MSILERQKKKAGLTHKEYPAFKKNNHVKYQEKNFEPSLERGLALYYTDDESFMILA